MGLILAKIRALHRKKIKIGLVGFYAAGKTQIIYQLLKHRGPGCNYVKPKQLYSIHIEEYEFENTIFYKLDFPYNKRLTPLYLQYFNDLEGLIFVIDSTDTKLFEQAQDELYFFTKNLIQNQIPLLVYVNKQDLCQERDKNNNFTKILELQILPGITEFRVQKSSAYQSQVAGLYEGYEWLLSKILKIN